MKTFKLTIFAFLAFIVCAIPGVYAAADVATVGGAEICDQNGQSYDAATWLWTGAQWEAEYQRPGFQTIVTGDESAQAWTSNRVIRAAYAVGPLGVTQIGTSVRSGNSAVESTQAIVLCITGSSGGSNRAAAAEGGGGLGAAASVNGEEFMGCLVAGVAVCPTSGGRRKNER